MDSTKGTYVWVHMAETYPKMLVQLYTGMIRIFVNHTASLKDGLALMEDKVKDKWLGGSSITCLCCAATKPCAPISPTSHSSHIRIPG
jgi:hypothetical protein